jgi:hypothetical protein
MFFTQASERISHIFKLKLNFEYPLFYTTNGKLLYNKAGHRRQHNIAHAL